MKKLSMAILVVIMAAMASCGNGSGSGNGSASGGSDTISITTDSVVVKDSLGTFRVVAEVPDGGGKVLRRIVNEWIAEQLDGYYTGSYDSVAPILRFAVDSMVADAHKEIAGFHGEGMSEADWQSVAGNSIDDNKFSKMAEGKDFLTWSYTNYTYFSGAAHGLSPFWGQTFRKSDGRRIGWDVLRNTDSEAFQKLMHDGLKDYIGATTDDELRAMFLDESDFYVTPLPQCPPLFTKDGVKFVYAQYEIAAYAVGLPTFTISYKDLRPYMKQTALRLVE